jgi:dolichyl-phosphate beta-glucosyltransferase
MIDPAVRLSVVIPSYNEAHRIGRTLEELRARLPSVAPSWEIRVVDDGSTDATAAIVEAAARDDGRIVLQREPHRGKGGAVRHGMLQARGALRFMCDADLSMPIAGIAPFVASVPADYDIAIATREGAASLRVGEPNHRHILGRVFNWLVQATLFSEFADTQCGFKMFSAAAAEAVFPLTTIDGWAFDIEVLVIAKQQEWRLGEVPIEWHYRDRSQVSPLRDPFTMARDVLKIRANRRRGLYDRPR